MRIFGLRVSDYQVKLEHTKVPVQRYAHRASMMRMKFLVKVRVNLATMNEFGRQLQAGVLDRSGIVSETFCIKGDPAVGFSVWEAEDRIAFDKKFGPWREYYSEADITEVITPAEAMAALMKMIKK
jgi:hypothetical protein